MIVWLLQYNICTVVTDRLMLLLLMLGFIPELGLQGGSPSWPAPHGCTHLGSGTSQRHAPAHAAGRLWRWCGSVCVSSWADHLCMALKTCLHRFLHPSSIHSVPPRTCLWISQYLFSTQEKILWYFTCELHLQQTWQKQEDKRKTKAE